MKVTASEERRKTASAKNKLAANRSAPQPKDNDIVVVSANLEEVHDPADTSRSDDMEAFAQRVADLVPRAPDVLFLQEVLASAAAAVAGYLKETTGVGYSVAVPAAPRSPRLKTAATDCVRDTAILINAETTSIKGPKGFLATKYDRKDCHPDKPLARTKEHARILVRHEPSGTRLGLMSVHLAPRSAIVTRERFHVHAERWANELVAEMKAKHPKKGRQINLLAGDFNTPRCLERRQKIDCDETALWKAFNGLGYRDAVFEIHGHSEQAFRKQHRKGNKPAARIDYIFIDKGEVLDATHDVNPPAKGTAGYYADHRLLWAVIRPPARKKKR
jgi:endonuclease/exonuclease/phosphatase family metal-dependent hydrolase